MLLKFTLLSFRTIFVGLTTFLDLGGNTIRYRYQQQLRELTIFLISKYGLWFSLQPQFVLDEPLIA